MVEIRDPLSIYERCFNFDDFRSQTLVWIDSHPDFHSKNTSLSGYVGGMALYNIRHRFKRIYILGARDIEHGEAENVNEEPHVHFITSCRFLEIVGDLHVHVDVDVLDPSLVNVKFPVAFGMTLDELFLHIECLPSPIATFSFSNASENVLAKLISRARIAIEASNQN